MNIENKQKTKCIITKLWASVEAMKKDLFIDLDKQEVIRLATGNKLTPYLVQSNMKYEKRHYAVAFCNNGERHNLLLHRLFFYWHYGYLPSLVDHKDTNSQNNSIDNLRELNKSGNARNSNRIKNNTSSKYRGVYWVEKSKKWRVRLMCNRKYIEVGYFFDEDEAGQAFNDKIRELGLEEVSVLNDTPQERARKINLFNEQKELTYS